MMAPIRGFMPSLDRRRSIASKSGTRGESCGESCQEAHNLRYLARTEQLLLVDNQVLATCQRDQTQNNAKQSDHVDSAHAYLHHSGYKTDKPATSWYLAVPADFKHLRSKMRFRPAA